MKSKTLLTLALCGSLIFSAGGCGSQPDSESGRDAAPKTVTDAKGRTIDKPEKIEKAAITCYGGATHEISVLGASSRIVAQPSMERFPQLLKMFPAFRDVVDPGAFDEVNTEELLKASPDMVFVGVTASKGNKLIEEAGLSTFTMLIGTADIENLKTEFEMAGILLDNPEQAKKLVDYWNKKLEELDGLLSGIPEDQRKTVYYAGSSITSANTGVWGDNLLRCAGGRNVTAELTRGAKGSEISVEQILQWDPDVIITQKTPKGLSAFENDDRIRDLSAVKNKEMHLCPIGAFWWDRPSPESPLGFLWLATVLYPEQTKSIDLKKETVEFYKTFYQYDLSDEEYESFF